MTGQQVDAPPNCHADQNGWQAGMDALPFVAMIFSCRTTHG
jgi:hypothetical protein